MARACLVIFCGLPGSGKTSLIHSILKIHENRPNQDQVIVHVNYDAIIPADVERKLIEESKGNVTEVSSWKTHRGYIHDCVESLLLNHLNHTSPNKKLNIQQDIPEDFRENFGKNCRPNGMIQNGGGRLIILVDDNMYYSSMRYQYYQLARKYEIGFGEVFVNCPVEAAIERNRKRQPKVTDDVIIAMATKIEPPDPRELWEKYSVTVNLENSTTKAVDAVMELILEAVSDPVKDVILQQLVISAESRTVCSTNIIHQADQILRQLVTQAIKQQQGGKTKEDMRVFAQSVNSWRSLILSEMKEGLIRIPCSLQDVKDAAKDSTSPLFVFVKDVFDSRSKGIS